MKIKSINLSSAVAILQQLFLGFCLSVSALSVQAETGFTVEKIRIEGLERIKASTVLNYLPVRKGAFLAKSKTSKIIRALYSTGFFRSVRLQRSGNVLVVRVIERATIGVINITGNKDLSTTYLKDVVKKLGLQKGRVFQVALLERLKEQLKQAYNAKGKYNAKISTSITPLTQNRVAIKITLSEGRVARIKKINFYGNKKVSTSQLQSLMQLQTSSLLTYITKKDQYSQYAMDASLQEIKNYYLDRGYLKFQIESSKMLLSEDKKSVYINIKINEGPLYRLSGFKITGRYMLPIAQLNALVSIKKQQIFSRKVITDSITAIGNALGNNGYGFPAINAHPSINETEHTVFITIDINAGQHVYVRRINFSGNTKTADYVLRHATKQDEGALLSLNKVKESERQLRVLGYLKNVEVKTVPVPGTRNQVDLNYSVEEAPSAEATASVGYGTNGLEFNASFNQHNFLGTGRTLGLNFNTSYWGRNYGFNYYNPYYTRDGIGRGFSAYYQTVDPRNLDISTYTSDKYGFATNYNVPLSFHSSLQLGAGYERLRITSQGKEPSTQLTSFIATNGSNFHQVRLTSGWNRNNYDQVPFPTSGINQQLTMLAALPLSSRSLSYYKASYLIHGYYPIAHSGFILSLLGNVGYGNSFNHKGLPFYENYYAGGIAQPGQVRGYDNYSVGPKDSVGNNMGGNLLASGSLGMVLPYPLSRETIRTTAFVDVGNVWARHLPRDQQGTPAGPARYSAGVSVDWRSPFGPLAFSLASPLNKQPGDESRQFQFSISSGF